MTNDHYKDTLLKIQDLGSKKIVRDYLEEMRQEICRDYLQNIYGEEKADNLLTELQHGLTTAKSQILESDEEAESDSSRRSKPFFDAALVVSPPAPVA